MLATLPAPDVSPDEKRRVLERVLHSRTFSRSDQLKRFLRYVCEKDIEGKSEEINEYSVAVEALGRSPDYSSADDSSVRTRAHALRQKLQEYYETEDPEADLRIDIAKGGYNPQFLIRAPVAAPHSEAPLTAIIERPGPVRRNGLKPFLTGVLTASLILISILIFTRAFDNAPRMDPILREAWRQMLIPGEAVEVYIATPPAMLLHSYRDDRIPAFPAPLLPAPPDVSSWYTALQMKDGGGKLYMHTTQDVFLFGDSLAGTSAVQLLSQAGALPKIVPEVNLRAFVLRDRNVVLIGSPNYSPLAARFLINAPFSVRYDPVRRQEVVSDDPPDHVAKRVFRPSSDEFGMLTRAYGLITVLPSEAHGDSGAQTIIFSGITSAGPQGALEFFRSPENLRVLKAKFRQEGYATFPRAYQVVVRCGLDHNLALTWEYAAHEVIKNSPLLQ